MDAEEIAQLLIQERDEALDKLAVAERDRRLAIAKLREALNFRTKKEDDGEDEKSEEKSEKDDGRARLLRSSILILSRQKIFPLPEDESESTSVQELPRKAEGPSSVSLV